MLALPNRREEYSYDPATGLGSGQRVLRGATPCSISPTTTCVRGQLAAEQASSHARSTIRRAQGSKLRLRWLGPPHPGGGGNSASPLWTQEYGYDRFGNRTGVAASGVRRAERRSADSLAALTYDDFRKPISTPEFAYDAAGNLIRSQRPDGAWQRYRYDAAGRLAQVLNDAGSAAEAYAYGPDRRRLMTTHASGERTYNAWNGDTPITVSHEASGSSTPQWRKSYFHFVGRLLATASLEGASRVVRYHHPDQLGRASSPTRRAIRWPSRKHCRSAPR